MRQRFDSRSGSHTMGAQAVGQHRMVHGMRVSVSAALLLLVLLNQRATAYPRPPEGTEPIPELMAKANLVCKGLVTSAPPAITGSSYTREKTGIANVQVDRCFKGQAESPDILVLFNSILSPVGGPAVFLRTGDYYLFFLTKQGNGKYLPFDDFFSTLRISRLLGDAPRDADPMQLLELDLKAGLKDGDQERVRDSIRMLGNMRHLRSTRELKARAQDPDLLTRTYVWQALMRLGDCSVLPSVAEFFRTQPEAHESIRLPEGRLLSMQSELAQALFWINDPSCLDKLYVFLSVPNRWARQEALQSVRKIGSPASAPYLYQMLDDSDVDNRFGAMQGLLSLASNTYRSWVPSWEDFRKQPDVYVARCKQWWNTEGKANATWSMDRRNN
jgi:hypothetical protein